MKKADQGQTDDDADQHPSTDSTEHGLHPHS
jgi:hypothetical protein